MRSIVIVPVLIALVVTALSSVFIVDERKKALVLQFGQVRQIKEDAGLGFKMPFIQEVVYYEDRILGLKTAPIEVTLLSDRRLVVDAFARWRISDLQAFRQAVGAGAEERAQALLNNILQQAIPEVLGNTTQDRVLSQDRSALMNEILTIARREAQSMGVQVIDVRLTRTDLPDANLKATFDRMRSERDREAADEIARGGEAAQRVRAAADRTVVEETSLARRSASVIRGEADAERNAILAEAYGKDPEFFAFIRSLTAYEQALKGSNSSIVMEPDSDFFSYLRSPGSSAYTPVETPETLPSPEEVTPAPQPAPQPVPAPAPVE
ncbi:protease modulator HflC [Pseudogemmobacter bohemicus]|uniref:protease modulator HflC n=1 Tax=Pseudogemmobacter bohemicus TaxID=2250708 RepID=UPI0038CDC1DD